MTNITQTLVVLIIVVCLLVAMVIISIQVTKITKMLSGSKNEVQPKTQETPVEDGPATEVALMKWVDTKMKQTKLYSRKDLDLKTAAQIFGLSQRHLARLMKSQPQYGTFNEYLTQTRLEAACNLLREKPFYKVESVAQEAGFSSRKTFQTLFKARMGVTPSAYRDKVKTEENN